MSSISLIRAPSWSGLDPGLPEFAPIAPYEAENLLRLFGLSGQLSELRFDSFRSSQYKLETVGGSAFLLKIVEPSRRASVERAEAIADWLAHRELVVAGPCDGFPLVLADGRLLTCCSYIEGRRIALKEKDLAGLGRGAATLHDALADHPDRNTWLGFTRRRLDTLAEIRSDLAHGRLSCGPEPELLQALASDRGLCFALPGPATPLHGDLNPGNALVSGGSMGLVLLDFEDVFHSVLSPLFELLLAVERFVLVRTDDDALALGLASGLLDAYRSAGGSVPQSPKPSTVLRALSLRSLCVLALGVVQGIAVAEKEWRKFFYLEAQARRRAGLVDQAFAV